MSELQDLSLIKLLVYYYLLICKTSFEIILGLLTFTLKDLAIWLKEENISSSLKGLRVWWNILHVRISAP